MKKKTPKSLVPSNIKDEAKSLLNAYIVEEKIGDFALIPTHIKLELLQKTPPRFIQQRDIGGKTVHFIGHQYSKQCLNFAFNFRVSNEVTNEQYYEYVEKYTKQVKDKVSGGLKWVEAERNVIEAECTVRFTFQWPSGETTTRTVHSQHKQYKNPAICRGDAMQAAISKAWTKAAATFGIGADLEDDLYVKKNDPEPQVEPLEDEIAPPPSKTFAPGF